MIEILEENGCWELKKIKKKMKQLAAEATKINY